MTTIDIYSIVFGTIIVGLIIALIAVFIIYFRDIIRGFLEAIRPEPLSIRTWVFAPIWFIFYGLNKLFKWNIIEVTTDQDGQSEERYKSTKNLKFDFSSGQKFISFPKPDISTIINDFLEFSEGKYKLEDFKLDSKKNLVECPKEILFLDFCILVQHVWNEQKSRAYGVYSSPSISFYFYQDPKTLHNLIGETKDGKRFSLYTLDDLNKETQLRLNSSLDVESFSIDIATTSN